MHVRLAAPEGWRTTQRADGPGAHCPRRRGHWLAGRDAVRRGGCWSGHRPIAAFGARLGRGPAVVAVATVFPATHRRTPLQEREQSVSRERWSTPGWWTPWLASRLLDWVCCSTAWRCARGGDLRPAADGGILRGRTTTSMLLTCRGADRSRPIRGDIALQCVVRRRSSVAVATKPRAAEVGRRGVPAAGPGPDLLVRIASCRGRRAGAAAARRLDRCGPSRGAALSLTSRPSPAAWIAACDLFDPGCRAGRQRTSARSLRRPTRPRRPAGRVARQRRVRFSTSATSLRSAGQPRWPRRWRASAALGSTTSPRRPARHRPARRRPAPELPLGWSVICSRILLVDQGASRPVLWSGSDLAELAWYGAGPVVDGGAGAGRGRRAGAGARRRCWLEQAASNLVHNAEGTAGVLVSLAVSHADPGRPLEGGMHPLAWCAGWLIGSDISSSGFAGCPTGTRGSRTPAAVPGSRWSRSTCGWTPAWVWVTTHPPAGPGPVVELGAAG